MSMSDNRPESFVIKWSIIMFIIMAATSLLLLHNNNLLIGLSIGAFLGILRLKMNALNFTKILSSEKTPHTLLLIIFNIFSMALFFLLLYLILNKLNHIDIYTVGGLCIGFGLIPLVIIVASVLKSLYIIRKSF